MTSGAAMFIPHPAWRRAVAGPGLCAALALCACLSVQAAGKLDLQFVAPEKYSDIGRGSHDRERNLKSLADYLQTLAAQLPESQALKLEVLDIDLAGELRPRAAQDVRVLRGRADWPQMSLRYTLTQNGTTLKSGEARLSDMGYLDHARCSDRGYGDLPYDKRMLQDWFRKTLMAP
jgi:hypothetical protein